MLGLRNLFQLKEISACWTTEGDVIEMFRSRSVYRFERRTWADIQTILSRHIYDVWTCSPGPHLFILHAFFESLPFSHMLSSSPQLVLEKVGMQTLDTQYSEMMLWILIIGILSGIHL